MAIYTLYLYDAQDFDGGLPREYRAKAEGGRCQDVTFSAGARGQTIKIEDNDNSFDEIDRSGQSLAEPVTIGGKTYPAGTKIWTAYDLENSGTGHRITSIHLGGSGYQQGAVHGCVSTEVLEPGETYNFNVNRTSYGRSNAYDAEYVPCLVAGTPVATPSGPRLVEHLACGDHVITQDSGAQPIRHIWSHSCVGRAKAAPVRIPAGALGDHGALLLSAEHRVLLNRVQAQMVCGWDKEAFVAAKFLVGRWGITRQDQRRVQYWHMLLDQHHIITAAGLPVETYLWTVKPSEPFGAPKVEDIAGQFSADRLATSWAPARPIIRRRHLRPIAIRSAAQPEPV